jgi:60 kDa SS-A/Ro ribonucleoprotein
MVRGKAGGMVFAVDDLMRLQRFLILGAEGGTYYTKPRKHTAENLAALLRLLKAGRGVEVVALIQAISTAGRRARPQANADHDRAGAVRAAGTKQAAYAALPAICRIPTHLFEFIEHAEAAAKTATGGTGWGRALGALVHGAQAAELG